jgi:PAS domain S-box-containing protein
MMTKKPPENLRADSEKLAAENRELRLRLQEAERALEALRTGLAEALGNQAGSLTEQKRAEEDRRQAMAKAEAGDRMLATLMANVPDGITVCDTEGKLRMVSQHGQDLLGGAHAGKDIEEVAREWTIYLPDGQTQMPLAEIPLNRALRGEVVRDVELVQVNATGRKLPLLCNAAPIRDADGGIVGGVVAWRDISERMRAEEALQSSEKKYRDLFGSMIEGFAVHEIILDAEGKPIDFRFLDLNPAFERLTGLDRQVIGKTHNQILPDDDPKWVQIYGRVALTGEPIRFENYSPALKRHYEVAAFRSTPGHFATVFADITDRKQVEQALRDSERLYRAIGETIDYGVWVCDPDGRNIYASDSFLKLVGLTQEQCSNFGWGDVLHPEDTERTMTAWKECIRSEGNWDIEHRFRGVDGQWHPILARGVPVRNEQGTITCWAGINLDIGRLKKTETALREADQRKNEFLAMLSHELRNPLAAVHNSLYILDRAEHDSAQSHRAKQVIERQVGQLTRLVDDLLDVTRITRGKIQLRRQPLDLTELLHRTCEDHRPEFAQAEVEFEVCLVERPMRIKADATRIAQAVGNLLHNAAKFTPKGGHVRLSLEEDKPRRQAVIGVGDTGVGMAANVMGRLFQPFSQAHQTLDRSKGGLGLGLSLVKGLVDLHGGSVEAHSDGPGKGAEFTVRLPLLIGGADHETPAAQTLKAASRSVLIIEDNVDAAESLRDVLILSGHQVQVAHNAESGLEKARASRPEVILCDIGLPGMDGYGVARAVRSEPGLRSVFMVALTGYALPEDVERARDAGFNEHLAKPPNLEKVEQILTRLHGA